MLPPPPVDVIHSSSGWHTFLVYIYTLYVILSVRAACYKLEAVTELQSLENCMDSLTPEWLKSLILDDPDGSSTVVARMVEDDPDSCLNLLLVGCQTFLDPLKCDI